jgi:hypothetical protein
MDRVAAPPDHCAVAPYGFIAGVQGWVLRTQWLVPLFGINFKATSKNREIGGALALGSCRSINTYNNQMEVGAQGGGYIEEEVRSGRNVWRGRGPVVFAIKWSVENKEKNYILALDGC